MKLWISKSEYGFYNTLKGKDKDKNPIKYYLDVSFFECAEPEVAGQIEINDGDYFFGCYNTKNGIKPKIIVKNYTFLQASEYGDEVKPAAKPVTKKVEKDPFEEFGDTVSVENNDFLD